MSEMPPELRQVVDDFRGTLTKIRAKQDEYDRELKRGRADPLMKAQIDQMAADLDALHRKANRPHVADAGYRSSPAMEAKANQEFARWLGREGDSSSIATHRKDYARALAKYLRLTKNALTPDEVKTLSVGSAPDGGFFVEPHRARTLVDKIYETSPTRAVAPAIEISSNTYSEPVDRDTIGSGWVGEQSGRPATASPQIGMLEIPVHEQYALIPATQNLLDDSGVNIEAWLDQKTADELARQENTAFVTGNGVSKPKGFLSYPTAATADASRPFGTLEFIKTGVNGAFKTLTAGPPIVNPADDLLTLIYKFKAGYRSRLQWAMNRVTLGATRAFKDLNGNYIYDSRLGERGLVETLFGYQVVEFSDMPDFTTTGANAIALGDWSRGFLVIDRLGLRVLRDPYTSKGIVQFYTTKRVGGAVRDSDAIKLLQFAA